jgi:hypothetical protein
VEDCVGKRVFACRCSHRSSQGRSAVVGIRHVGPPITLGPGVNCDILPHFSRQCMPLSRKTYCGLPCSCQRYHLHFAVLLYLPEGPSTCSLPDLPVCFHADGDALALTTRWLFRLCFMALLPKSLINRSGGTIVSSNQTIRSASGVSHFRTEPHWPVC